MGIVTSSLVMIKVKGYLRPILIQKAMVGFVLAIPFGTTFYLWMHTRDLNQKITSLMAEVQDGDMLIGCEFTHNMKRGSNEKESFEPLLSDEENLVYLETTIIETKSRIEGLADTVRFLKEQIRTIHKDSKTIYKILNQLQACHKS